MVRSPLAWLAGLLMLFAVIGQNAYAKGGPQSASKELSCIVKNLTVQFENQQREAYDTSLGAVIPLRGEPFRDQLSVGGEQVSLFRKLGEGGYGNAYLGYENGKIVVAKEAKLSGIATGAFRREIILTRFLNRKGFTITPILKDSETSEGQQILIKPYVPGFHVEDLERKASIGAISRSQLSDAKSKLHELQFRLRRLSTSPEFQVWAKSNDLPQFIDLDDSNFLYSEGRWIMIDP